MLPLNSCKLVPSRFIETWRRWRNQSEPVEVSVYLATTGSFELVCSLEHYLSQPTGRLSILVVADKFWPLPTAISSLWEETYRVSVFGKGPAPRSAFFRRWVGRIRHYRRLHGVNRAVRGRRVTNIIASDSSTTWVLSRLYPDAKVTLIDEGYSSIVSNVNRLNILQGDQDDQLDQDILTRAVSEFKQRIRLSAPVRPSVTYFSAFEASIGALDTLVCNDFRSVRKQFADHKIDPELAWIVGSAAAVNHSISTKQYMLLISETSAELRRMGASRIAYMASPHERARPPEYFEGLVGGNESAMPLIDEIVPSTKSLPIELRLLTESRPGIAIAVMPYTSALVSLACMYRDKGTSLLSATCHPGKDQTCSSAPDRIHGVASSINEDIITIQIQRRGAGGQT